MSTHLEKFIDANNQILAYYIKHDLIRPDQMLKYELDVNSFKIILCWKELYTFNIEIEVLEDGTVIETCDGDPLNYNSVQEYVKYLEELFSFY